MNKDRAFSIVKTLSNSTWLQSEKDEAVRVVMETDPTLNTRKAKTVERGRRRHGR